MFVISDCIHLQEKGQLVVKYRVCGVKHIRVCIDTNRKV
jgi:hypothetical protein